MKRVVGGMIMITAVFAALAWLNQGEVIQVEGIVRDAEPNQAIIVDEGPVEVLPLPPPKQAAPKKSPAPIEPKKEAIPAIALQPIPMAPKAPEPKGIAPTPIIMQSVLAVRCKFSDGAGTTITAFGSGVMVGEGGYALTARHVVDMDYTFRITGGRQGRAGFKLETCDVGGPPEGVRAPSVQDIRAINPFTEVLSLPYRAEVAFVPGAQSGKGLSEAEADFLDIAIVKVTGPTPDAAKFFGVTAPASFPKSELAAKSLPGIGEELITFGFPSGAPAYGSSFRLQGSVGTVRQFVAGDLLFRDQPLGIEAEMETIGGRSGSPVFWRGRVVGVVSAKRDYSKDATIVSVYPLAKLLEGSGVALDIP